MNKVWIIGNLTKDVELSNSQRGNPIARFFVAVRRDFKNSEGNYDSDYISCVAYNKMAETINTYFHKGSRFNGVGHIQTGSYDNKDGKKVYTTYVVVEIIEFDRNGSEKKEEPKEEKKETKKLSNDPFEEFGQKVEIEEKLPWED